MYSLIFFCILRLTASEVINTSSGPVQGVASLADDVEAYLGIPYAEPPVGELRFAMPLPKRKWANVFHASTVGPPCSQVGYEHYYFMPNLTNMSEDCLYLNIWAPKKEPSEGLRPVIIFFHPGGFITGSASIKAHDGSHLASRGDLIVVTVNYRLGAFGYFLTNIKEANGSMGEFDKIMAIKWIKENAKYFNGDPDNICLMGASAGAVSISGLMLSPLTKNLFKRVIIISGSMMHPIFTNERLFANSEKIASVAGCANDSVTLKNDPHVVMKCLKNKSEYDLINAHRIILLTNPVLFFPKVNNDVLSKSVLDLIREGKFRKDMDVLLGVTENEGGLFLFLGVPQYVGLYGENLETMTKRRALTLSRSAFLLSGQKNFSEIIDYYLKHVKNRTTTGYVKMVSNIIGDFTSSCNLIYSGDMISLKGNSVYFYKFGFRPVSALTAEWIGATHLDDIQYIFGSPYHGRFSEKEIALSHSLIDRFSAFARTGNPNVAGQVPWLRYSYHNPLYLHIGQEEESIRLRPNERCEIWRKRFNADIDAELIRNLRNSDAE